jgi:GNAT superfamily N-acetyltransferase
VSSTNDEIRLLNLRDIPAALQLSSGAGWNQTAEDWRLLLQLEPEGCFCIQMDDALAATATLFCYERQLAWVGMVLTHPDYRRRGLATRLLMCALARADALGIRTVKLDATEQGQPLYVNLGFAPEQGVERWFRASRRIIHKAGSACTTDSPMWRVLDANAFGVDRGTLLQALVRRGRCFTNANAFLLTRTGRNSRYLGPCVARDPDSARELIQLEIQNREAGGWSWDLFPQNHHAVALATQLGFAPQRRLVRMSRGEELPGDAQLTYAIAGFEFG